MTRRLSMSEDWFDCEMNLRLPKGSIYGCKIVELSFFYKEHKIVRGLLHRTIEQAKSEISLVP